MDQRAQGSIGIARFFLALVVGAFVFWIVSLVTKPILDGARETTNNSTANQATAWISDGVNYLPVWFLIVSFFGIIIGAIYAREVLG